MQRPAPLRTGRAQTAGRAAAQLADRASLDGSIRTYSRTAAQLADHAPLNGDRAPRVSRTAAQLAQREPWNGPSAWWQPGRCAARPARAHEPTKREREATRCTAYRPLVKWQPNRCAARPARAHEPTAREVAAGPLRSLPITSTLTYKSSQGTKIVRSDRLL